MGFWKNEEGVTAVEYALIAALIALAVLGAYQTIGQEARNALNQVSTEMQNATNDTDS